MTIPETHLRNVLEPLGFSFSPKLASKFESMNWGGGAGVENRRIWSRWIVARRWINGGDRLRGDREDILREI